VPTALVERLLDAQNRHDLDAFVACFDSAYRSEQPVHPERTFSGSDQVRANWGALFAGLADFSTELLRSAQDGDTWWAEWSWRATRDDRIAWGRLYMEEVEGAGAGIDETVRRLATGAE
jgi:hypothetical protein